MNLNPEIIELIYGKFQSNAINFIEEGQAFSISISLIDEDDEYNSKEPDFMLFGKINARKVNEIFSIELGNSYINIVFKSPIYDNAYSINIKCPNYVSESSIKFICEELYMTKYLKAIDDSSKELLEKIKSRNTE